MATSNPSPSAPQSFPNLIAEKLDDSNYLHWKQQIEPVIKSHKLQLFVVNPSIHRRYLIDEDRIANKVNLTYEAWEVQEQTLLTWLQSHCRSRFSLESLVRFTRIKSRIKFMSTSICRRRRVPANFALTFALPPLTARRCVSSNHRSRTLLMNS